MILYEHQRKLYERYKNESVIPIFADAGTGKTATTLAILSYKFNEGLINNVLIVAPNHVDIQWAREQVPLFLNVTHSLLVWYKKGAYMITNDGGKNVIKSIHNAPVAPSKEYNIVITNVDQFSRSDSAKRYAFDFDGIVLDESTSIKNIKSKRTQNLLYTWSDITKRYGTVTRAVHKTKFRVILTGTPTTNTPLDLFTQMYFLDPTFWGGMGWYAFRQRYGVFTKMVVNNRSVDIPLTESMYNAIKRMSYGTANSRFGVSASDYEYIRDSEKYSGAYKNIEELKERLDKVASFVHIQDVVDMPKQNYIERKFYLSDTQEKLLRIFENKVTVEWAGLKVSATSMLAVHLRKMQITIGFVSGAPIPPPNLKPKDLAKYLSLPVGSETVPCERINLLKADIAEISVPCIVFTNFVAEADFVYSELQKEFPVRKVALCTGWYSTPNCIEDFKVGKIDILVANTDVLAKGFNFQVCYYTMFYSNTQSAEDRIQAEARTWRIGQDHPCFYYDYIAISNYGNKSIDEEIMEKQKERKKTLEYITETT